mmetsp:Transcript_106705/g.340617  ORF Transcript_106705/g.340617 Transcript_106705/m.340617 type:complete len:215 (+) Transcript_106705:2814-3458(+)
MRQDELFRARFLGFHPNLVRLQRQRGRGGAEELVVELAGPLVEEAEERSEVRGRLEGHEIYRDLRVAVRLGGHPVQAEVEGFIGLASLRLDGVAVCVADRALAEDELELGVLGERVVHLNVHRADLVEHGRDRDGLAGLAARAAAAQLEDHGSGVHVAFSARSEDDLALDHSREAALELHGEAHGLLRLDLDDLVLDGEVRAGGQRDVVGDGLL